MSWGVEWTDKARRQLRKLPPDVQQRLMSFLKSRVEPGNDPRSLASCLSGDFSGLVGTDGFVDLPAGQTVFPAGFVAPFWAWV